MGQTIPVTVLTGFLGSGKTTLLNRILTENHGQRIAVIENEFGEIGVDQDLVINADEEIFEMNNGCICCTVRGDLIRILGNLAKRRDKFDRILVETTGLADPGPVAQTFFVDDDTRDSFDLDGVITMVDAKHAELHLDDSEEAMAQIAFADVLLINKIDLVDGDELNALERRLRAMNAMARIERVRMADAPMEQVLDVGGFDLRRALDIKPGFLEPEYPFEWGGVLHIDGTARFRLHNGPDPAMSAVLEPVDAATPEALTETAERVFTRFSAPDSVLKPGAAIRPGETHWTLGLTGAEHYEYMLEVDRPGLYALFTEHMPEEFDAGFCDAAGATLNVAVEHVFNPEHTHDDTVQSVALELDGEIEEFALSAWLSRLLQTQGPDIFRLKGIVALKGEDRRFVFQGVHMLFDGQPGAPWGDQRRSNRLVFIGRNLDEAALEQGLRDCRVQ
ncbi:MAG: GTP-binding protein [Alphaproteobacteria bacterium]|nr:GTP-binding protein [Alphaproteobacteria bacterium]